MQVELVPEPDRGIADAVRNAMHAIARDNDRSAAAYRSDWRRAALAEGIDRDPGYAPSPRSSRGATRA